ncbi:MAG: hypothetical protein QOJ66_1154 [Ilumatobacteraceae bacterium]
MTATILDGVTESLGQTPTSGDQHKFGAGQRVAEIRHQRDDILGTEPTDPASHYNTGLGEEWRSLSGVDDRSHFVLVVVELIDHQRTVTVADQAVHDLGHCGEQKRLVVAGDEVDCHAVSDWHIVGRVAPMMPNDQRQEDRYHCSPADRAPQR